MNYEDMSNEELALLAKKRDEKAFNVLYERNFGLIIDATKKYKPPKGFNREDLHSEATIGFLQAVNTFNAKKGKFSTYAYRCAYFRVKYFIRLSKSQKRNNSWDISTNKLIRENSDLSFADVIEDNSAIVVEKRILKNELKERMLKYFKKLSKNEQEVLYDYYFKDMTQPEIAKKKKVSGQAISKTKISAEKKLRKYIPYSYKEYLNYI